MDTILSSRPSNSRFPRMGRIGRLFFLGSSRNLDWKYCYRGSTRLPTEESMDELILTDKGRQYLDSLRNKWMETETFSEREREDNALLGWIDTGYITSPGEAISRAQGSEVLVSRIRQGYRRLYEAGYLEAS